MPPRSKTARAIGPESARGRSSFSNVSPPKDCVLHVAFHDSSLPHRAAQGENCGSTCGQQTRRNSRAARAGTMADGDDEVRKGPRTASADCADSVPHRSVCCAAAWSRAASSSATGARRWPAGPWPTCSYPTPRSPVSYTHLRAHETDSYLVCRLLLEKKKKT